MSTLMLVTATKSFCNRTIRKPTLFRPTVQNLHSMKRSPTSRSENSHFTRKQWYKSLSLTEMKSPHPVAPTCFIVRAFHTGQPDEDIIFRQVKKNIKNRVEMKKSGPYVRYDLKKEFRDAVTRDASTKEAILIDPVIETVDRDIRIVYELGLNLIYAANTHVHADHITGTGKIKKLLPTCKSVIAEASKAKADIRLKEGNLIKFGKFQIEARSTPGHTDGCLSFVWHEKGLVFTGDALLIRGCGRTDFQQGSAASLYDSVHEKIFSLPQHFKVFPAHDYTGQTMSTVGEELRFNPRLTRPKNEFTEMMSRLSLPYPKQIEKALPANMVCGVFDVPASANN